MAKKPNQAPPEILGGDYEFETVSAEFFSFDKEGDQVLGEVMGFGDTEVKAEGGEMRTVPIMIMEDHERGRISFIMPHQIADAKHTDKFEVGDILRIVFKGQKKTRSGNNVNIFDVAKAKKKS